MKMCIERSAEDFSTIHHELGHIFYYQAYNSTQPSVFQGGANDGFHEAVGDLLTLSITPDYYNKIGLISEAEAQRCKIRSNILTYAASLGWSGFCSLDLDA